MQRYQRYQRGDERRVAFGGFFRFLNHVFEFLFGISCSNVLVGSALAWRFAAHGKVGLRLDNRLSGG